MECNQSFHLQRRNNTATCTHTTSDVVQCYIVSAGADPDIYISRGWLSGYETGMYKNNTASSVYCRSRPNSMFNYNVKGWIRGG